MTGVCFQPKEDLEIERGIFSKIGIKVTSTVRMFQNSVGGLW